MEFDELPKRVIGDCAIEVHRELGPRLLESPYEQCLVTKLKSGIKRFVLLRVLRGEIVLYLYESLGASLSLQLPTRNDKEPK